MGIDTTDFEFEKGNYINYSFLDHLYSAYYEIKPKFIFGKKERYIDTQTLITDSLGNLVVTADFRLVYNQQSNNSRLHTARIAKMFFDGEIDFAFILGYPHTIHYTVGIKGNELFVIHNSKKNFQVYSWEEFIENHFDEWVRQ